MQRSKDGKRAAEQSTSVEKRDDASFIFPFSLPYASQSDVLDADSFQFPPLPYPSQIAMMEAHNSPSPLISSCIEPPAVSGKSL